MQPINACQIRNKWSQKSIESSCETLEFYFLLLETHEQYFPIATDENIPSLEQYMLKVTTVIPITRTAWEDV